MSDTTTARGEQHTPEPWRRGSDEEGGRMLLTAHTGAYIADFATEADARRAEACVNGFDEIFSLWQQQRERIEQQDALLADAVAAISQAREEFRKAGIIEGEPDATIIALLDGFLARIEAARSTTEDA